MSINQIERGDVISHGYASGIGTGKNRVTIIEQQLADLNREHPGERKKSRTLQDPEYLTLRGKLIDERNEILGNTRTLKRELRGRLKFQASRT